MKKEIICMKCNNTIDIVGYQKYPGECVKYVLGYALVNYQCDLCHNTIIKDEICCAMSNWSKYGIPYCEWEHDYIDIDPDIKEKIKVARKVKGVPEGEFTFR